MKWTLNNNADFTLENCLIGAVQLTKNADVDKYKYFGYDTGCDGEFFRIQLVVLVITQ